MRVGSKLTLLTNYRFPEKHASQLAWVLLSPPPL